MRLEKPPPPAPPAALAPPPAPPTPPWGCGQEACRVGYNLAAVEQKEDGGEAAQGKKNREHCLIPLLNFFTVMRGRYQVCSFV